MTCARGSIALFRVRRVEVITALQAVNCGLWFAEARVGWLASFGDPGYAAMLLWMTWVGCLGGASYVNCCYRMNYDAAVPDGVREEGLNMAFAFVNVGIILATAVSLVLNATVFSGVL